MAVIGSFLLLFAVIKSLSPEKEYEPPIDYIGRRLYRPIFFGTDDNPTKKSVKNQEEIFNEDEAFKDEVVENVEISDGPKSEPEPKKEESTPKTVEPSPMKKEEVNKTSITNSDNAESYFKQLIQDYQQNVLTKRKYRNDVVVRYYRHSSDQDRAKILVDFGFYLHERPVSKLRFDTVDSNVIYYGHDFPERDLKLITYLLVKNGIPIKSIRPFKDYDGWKRKSLEIGGIPKLQMKPTLTFSQIQNYKVQE
jgi:hypothetical protein